MVWWDCHCLLQDLHLWNLLNLLNNNIDFHGICPLRQDKKFGDLVDELHLLNLLSMKYCLDHRRLSKSCSVSTMFCLVCAVGELKLSLNIEQLNGSPVDLDAVSHLLNSCRKPATTCVEDETDDSSERFCCEELDLVLTLLHVISRVCRSPSSWLVSAQN